MNVLVIAPHCSTGGMPAYCYHYLQALPENYKVTFVEFSDHGSAHTVQRDLIQDWAKDSGNTYRCLNGQDEALIDLLDVQHWDIVHFQEEPGSFLQPLTLSKLLTRRHHFGLFLTVHERDIDFSALAYVADLYITICDWQTEQLKRQLPTALVEKWEVQISPKAWLRDYTTQNTILERLKLDPGKKHLIQVGLWHHFKQQHVTLEWARHLWPQYQIHLIGARAHNHRAYWESLEIPDNVTVWGERADVEEFLTIADGFLMPSAKELAPIALKEALAYGLPCYVSQIDVLTHAYQENQLVHFLDTADPKALEAALASPVLA